MADLVSDKSVDIETFRYVQNDIEPTGLGNLNDPLAVIYQTIILCVGWYVIRWDMGILFKILIIAVASFSLIMILYELLVRRFNIVRFFFGMRPKKKPSEAPAPRPEGTAA